MTRIRFKPKLLKQLSKETTKGREKLKLMAINSKKGESRRLLPNYYR